jgi:hypothetical protein
VNIIWHFTSLSFCGMDLLVLKRSQFDNLHTSMSMFPEDSRSSMTIGHIGHDSSLSKSNAQLLPGWLPFIFCLFLSGTCKSKLKHKRNSSTKYLYIFTLIPSHVIRGGPEQGSVWQAPHHFIVYFYSYINRDT